MDGRCETDPFDWAVDVCRSCYGEYCPDCLVNVRGHRHPICRHCAVVTAGVRPGGRIRRRGDKKTAKQRRKVLQEKASQRPNPSGLPPFPSVGATEPAPIPHSTVQAEVPPAPHDRRSTDAPVPAPTEAEVEVEAEVEAAAVSSPAADVPGERPVPPMSAAERLRALRNSVALKTRDDGEARR